MRRDVTLSALFIVLNGADSGLTYIILSRGGVEVNPVMAAVLAAGVPAGLVVKLFAGFAAGLWVQKYHPRTLPLLVAGMAFPVLWNVYHLVKN